MSYRFKRSPTQPKASTSLYRISVVAMLLAVTSGCFKPSKVESRSTDSNRPFDATRLPRNHDVVPVAILGGGIAGLTAAEYLAQANIPCIVIEGPKPGGALAQSPKVRNWPGIIEAPGVVITDGLKKQVLNLNVPITQEKVTRVDFSAWPRLVEVQDLNNPDKKRIIKAMAVIIAMGAEPNLLHVPGELNEKGSFSNHVSNCAVCDGSLYNGKKVAIVGGGDAAIIEADYLSDIASDVTILVRKDQLKAKDLHARDRVLVKPNVSVLFNSQIQQIKGGKHALSHIIVENNKSKAISAMHIDGLFLAIGSKPNTALLKGQLTLDNEGFAVLKNHQETVVPGVYAAGDISDREWVQATTAASDGCKAALQATRFLKDAGFQATPANQPSSSQKPSEPELPPTQPSDTAAGKELVEITSEKDFSDIVANASQPVVLDLFSPLCVPCKQMMPDLEDLKQAYKGSVSFAKYNIARKNGINLSRAMHSIQGVVPSSVPVLIFVKGGKEVTRLVGRKSPAIIKATLLRAFGIK